MAKFKIVHERPKCIGCGSCAATCPDFWEMAEDGFSRLKRGEKNMEENAKLDLEEIACNQEAADLCPVNCIHVYKGGKMII